MRAFARYAFTLVELLVVIGVIAVLAAIAFPVFLQVREKARQASCASNLHQVYLASLLYAQDHDGRFPPFVNVEPGLPCDIVQELDVSGTGRLSTGYCAPNLLRTGVTPYLRESGVWFCPDDPLAGQPTDGWLVAHQWSSYFFLFTRDMVMTPDGYLRVNGERRDPATSFLMGDPRLALEAQVHRDLQGTPRERLMYMQPGYSHSGGVNRCYADGHVKWYHPPGAGR